MKRNKIREINYEFVNNIIVKKCLKILIKIHSSIKKKMRYCPKFTSKDKYSYFSSCHIFGVAQSQFIR